MKFKRTTGSHHNKPVALNLLEQVFTCTGPIRNGVLISSTCGRQKAGCIWQSSSTYSQGALLV